ncbi:hypothetical protein C0992_008520, partial [Termitomyces sp. T32_za158]
MTITSTESTFFLPDTLADWPWKRNVNPLYLQVKAESSEWIQGFTAFTPEAQRAFDLCNFELLASLAYPYEIEEIVRAGCDLMNLFFLFDEYTDAAALCEVQNMAKIVMDAIRSPEKPRPAGECVVGEVARQFWKLSRKCASEGARRRFIQSFDQYTASVVEQALDRTRGYIRNIDEYFLVRRETIGAKPAFWILQFGLNLPEDVFDDPIIQRLTISCTDMLILGNDLCSYNVEQARGDDNHNIVTIVMHHQKLGLAEAMKWIGDYHSKLEQDFLTDLNHVPHFGHEIEGDLKRYLDGLGNW